MSNPNDYDREEFTPCPIQQAFVREQLIDQCVRAAFRKLYPFAASLCLREAHRTEFLTQYELDAIRSNWRAIWRPRGGA